MESRNDIALFALSSTESLGSQVASHLDIPLGRHEEREFEDGEHKARPLENVRGRHAFVIHSLYGDEEQSANDKLCRLLFFIGALKDSGARYVTAVMPYLCYGRKDRKTKPRDPVTTRYVACLLEAVGTDQVVVVDVHNLAAYQNAFRCLAEHLEARVLFADYFARHIGDAEAVVLSPDVGGVKRAAAFRDTLVARMGREISLGFMEKHRSAGVVSGETLVGDVEGKTVILLDDLISTGHTMVRAAKACRAAGADHVYAAATHGLFMSGAEQAVRDPAIKRYVITDTVPPFRLSPDAVEEKVIVLKSAPFLAQAIERLYSNGSLVGLHETLTEGVKFPPS